MRFALLVAFSLLEQRDAIVPCVRHLPFCKPLRIPDTGDLLSPAVAVRRVQREGAISDWLPVLYFPSERP